MNGIFTITVLCLFLIQQTNGAVIANFTVLYEYVASDEIVLLQNAIEDVGFISAMQVIPIKLSSKDIPPPPINVTANAISSTKINVTWLPVNVTINGNLTIVGYTVFYKRIIDDDDQWQRLSTSYKANSLIIENLAPFTTYTIRMLAFHSMGNGIASNFVDEKTKEGVPSSKPKGFKCVSQAPTTVNVVWLLLDSTLWNGYEKEYTVQYKIYNTNEKFNTLSFLSSKKVGLLENLQEFTKYEIYLMASTKVGPGPQAWCVVETLEGVPSTAPVISSWELDPDRPLEAIVRWDSILASEVNGRLTGYRIFYGISRQGKNRIEFPEMTSIVVDQYTTQITLKNILTTDMELTVKIAAMTKIGDGVESSATYVESCRCPKSIYSAWFENKPYCHQVGPHGSYEVHGIFPEYLQSMVNTLCKGCNGLKRGNVDKPSTLYWDRSKDGHSPVRKDEKQLKELVAHNVHLHVAMFGRAEIKNFQSDFKFVSIINSAGSAYIVRDPLAELDKTKSILMSLFACWPAIIIIVLLSMVAGIVVWTLDCQKNYEDFPNESFLNGIYHGTYWAFVSMTTVGYGDKTPVTCMAQAVAIAWMLMGPIINGIVIGAITTSLTTVRLEEDPKLYGASVGAIAHTFEYNLGVRRNAKMNTTGKDFATKEELLESLEKKTIDGILMDSLVAADLADVIGKKKMKLSKLIPEHSGWGVILSADFIKLEEDIRSYVTVHEEEMTKLVKNRTNGKLQVKAKPPSSLDTGIVDQNSKEFKDFVYYGLISLLIMAIIGLTYEHGFLRMRKNRVRPFSQEHRELLEDHLGGLVTDFCENIVAMIKKKSSYHESELKKFCWRKGYSFGVDGWLRRKKTNEAQLKKDILYQEIMYKDLGICRENSLNTHLEKWKKGKNIVRAAVRVKPAGESIF